MSRPTSVDLTAEQSWRPMPMPGSNGGVDLVPLASPAGALTLLVRFPAGFERSSPGGYRCSEEFLVLDGELDLEGTTYTRGDLAVVPANLVRTSMRTVGGALVLAWFGGPADFRAPEDLGATEGTIASVQIEGADGDLIASSVGAWSTVVPAGGETVDVVGADLGSWRRTNQPGADPVADTLVRRDLPQP